MESPLNIQTWTAQVKHLISKGLLSKALKIALTHNPECESIQSYSSAFKELERSYRLGFLSFDQWMEHYQKTAQLLIRYIKSQL